MEAQEEELGHVGCPRALVPDCHCHRQVGLGPLFARPSLFSGVSSVVGTRRISVFSGPQACVCCIV